MAVDARVAENTCHPNREQHFTVGFYLYICVRKLFVVTLRRSHHARSLPQDDPCQEYPL